MYQYIARLKSNKKEIVHGHNIVDIEHGLVHFKRNEGKSMDDLVDIIHIKRDQLHGTKKEVLVKTISINSIRD